MGDIWETLSNAVHGVGDVLDAVQQVRNLAESGTAWGPTPAGQALAPQVLPMPPFQPAIRDPHHGETPWLSQLQSLAAQHGTGWVPDRSAGLLGIDLTGLWAPPTNPMDQTYLRQSGPYVALVAGAGGVPGLFAEGVFDPASRTLRAVGRYITGVPMQAEVELLPNWVLHGWLSTQGPFGQAISAPIFMTRIA